MSDGRFKNGQLAPGQQRITRLTRTGCAVLWLALDERTLPMKDTHPLTLTDPAEAATAIGHAAAHALTHS